MYKKRKFQNAPKEQPNPALLNTIDENTTIKIARKEGNRNGQIPGKQVLSEGSEENIPFSQEQTQRYLSQRSTLAATLARTQSKNVSQRPANSYFELVLMRAGVHDSTSDSDSFVLSCDVIVFVNKLRDTLLRNPSYPENIHSFKSGLSVALSKQSPLLQKLLTGCTINVSEESIFQSQDSMFVNFLMIDFLRDQVLEVLLDKIEGVAIEKTSSLTSSNIPILPLLLTQLRYLSHSHVETIYVRVKDIFSKASDWAKWEIISNAEFILDVSKHDQFAQLMIETLTGTTDFFRTTTIQAFISLSLGIQLQAKLRCKILSYIKDGQCPSSLLPILIKFLLKVINEENDNDTIVLINSLREILIQRISSNTKSPTQQRQLQLEIFRYIEQSLKRSRKFYLLWQKIISSNSDYKFRSIDFVMLLLFVQIREENSLYISNILRRGIKNETITIHLLNEVKCNYCAVLEQYTGTLMQILHDFLREKQAVVSEFARAAYGVLFDICENVQRDILVKLLELTFDKKMQTLTTLSLNMIRDLQHKYPKDVQNCGTLLVPLLDRLNEMTMSQTRIVMDILCSIAFPSPNLNECPALQEQIDMLIKKQLINRTTYVKKQGIIGSVQLINSIARIETSSMDINDCNVTFDSVSDLPDGRGKIAAQYILRVQSSTLYNAESLALFYDELANACAMVPQSTNHIYYDKAFLTWICETITYNFQSNFICEETPSIQMHGLTLSNQKCINTRADTSTEEADSQVLSVAINIGELTLRPDNLDANSSILVLGPLFKLMRVLHCLRNEGSLEAINALLGCGLVLPTGFDDAEATFYTYDDIVQRKILDIHYHCINWMREAISSFATQCDSGIRQKLLTRLAELIHIENQLRKLLMRSPIDYIPPMSQFITSTSSAGINNKLNVRDKVSGNPRKAARGAPKKTNAANDSEVTHHTETRGTHFGDMTITRLALAGRNEKNATGSKPNYESLYGPKEIFRQMDSDLMLVLREKLCLTFPMPADEVGNKIGLQEFRFILTDLVCKLESVTGAAKFESEQSLQYIAKPDYFMNDLSKFLTVIVQNMEKISEVIGEHLSNVGDAYGHHDLFTEECNYLKVCFGLCIRLLAAFFSWPGFTDKNKDVLLKDSLLALLERSKALQMRNKSCAQISAAAFSNCIRFEPFILELRSAAHLYNLLLTLNRHALVITSSPLGSTSNSENDKQLENSRVQDVRALCKKLLCRKWYSYDNTLAKGTTCNYYLDELVRGFLKDSDFRRQEDILRTVQEEITRLNSKESALRSFPNIRKANFPLLFRGLCDALIAHLNNKLAVHNETSDKLKIWEKSSALLNMQLDIIQGLDIPRNFQPFLRSSHLYLKLVLHHGLTVLEIYLRQNPERVSNFLKSLQVTTRFLHNLCVHSKAIKQITIISQIPFLRETIEHLVFRVKALLASNKCANVFWMGSLKNKDLHGEEIVSQPVSLDASDDEEIPEDDLSVDETIFGQNDVLDDPHASSRSGNDHSKSSSRSKCF